MNIQAFERLPQRLANWMVRLRALLRASNRLSGVATLRPRSKSGRWPVRLQGLKGAAMAERERGVGFNSLSREVETNKAFYDGLLQRYKEVAAAAGAAAANITIVDPAWPPTSPDTSTLGRNLALAGIVGLLIALLSEASASECIMSFGQRPTCRGVSNSRHLGSCRA